ncbi:DUF732 domain-containing protein [[Mycobacterium] kokjensenii]|uniref:DUF732 domain-containing protein n=1 Tax=[Mycobacterium] kokjensenii TaxID=3064287 RepID=A0ABM9LAB4_9MYCO|nr:DUF732 domain-containing protein [Mycolicibacter sp. MU0083]CAJ1495641.1 DUF732 domain-containing protein [Mycolicibacter sp. MU0083]
MNRKLAVTVLGAVLACGPTAPIPAASADPNAEDQAFFDELQHEGLRPDYAKRICVSNKCEPLGTALVREGHEVCAALADAPRLVPVSVIADLQATPNEAHVIINASRLAYCPQSPDPYRRSPTSQG